MTATAKMADLTVSYSHIGLNQLLEQIQKLDAYELCTAPFDFTKK